MRIATRSPALASAATLLAALAFSASASPAEPTTALDAALSLVPKEAIAFVVVPSPKRASDDLGQCVERMNRPETAMAGRPIDQLKASLGISAAFDDKGTMALVQVSPKPEAMPVPLAVLPTTDPKAFLEGNFTRAPQSGEDAYTTRDGIVVFAKTVDRHVAISPDAEVVRSYVPGSTLAADLRERIGPRGSALLETGDVIVWGGSAAIGSAARMGKSMSGELLGAAEAGSTAEAEANRQAREAGRTFFFRMFEDVRDGLVVIDFDPLGLSVRTFAAFTKDSATATLTAGGADRPGGLSRLPKQPFYMAMRMDVAGLGGTAALQALAKEMPGFPPLPAWLIAAGERLEGLQFAVYPSKLGIATGGILNDALLVLESGDSATMKTALREGILALAGEVAGIRYEPTWTPDRKLKSGELADAFEVTETLVPGDASASEQAMRRLVSQLVYGSRGFVGLAKDLKGGVAMTFSQRPDVLDRGLKVGLGSPSLADDATLAAYRDWLIPNADIEGFVGIGQFGKLLEQVMAMIPGAGGVALPKIPQGVEPIAFAVEVEKGTVETALVIPTGVLALGYDSIRERVLGGTAAPSPTAAPAPAEPER